MSSTEKKKKKNNLPGVLSDRFEAQGPEEGQREQSRNWNRITGVLSQCRVGHPGCARRKTRGVLSLLLGAVSR